MSARVLVVGLDGACWGVVEPLVAQGAMPFLETLRSQGAWGTLVSGWPVATFPSWTSIMTGCPSPLHGVADFAVWDPATLSVRFVDSSWRRVPAVWEVASAAGKRCAVLGVPATFPPDPIDLMICGFDTPVTTSIDPSFIYPPHWRAKVAQLGGFPLTPIQELRIGRGWHRRAWEALRGSIEGKLKVACLAAREVEPHLMVVVFGESDTVCHHFWQFADRNSPRHVATADPSLAWAIQDVFARLDGAMRTLVDVCNPDVVAVVSDHGFGGAGNRAIYLNRYLAARGFLSFGRRGGPSPLWVGRWLPRGVQQGVCRRVPGLVARLEARRRVGGIRWDKTVAYSEELPYAPSVRINLKGREARGIVPPQRYHEVREEVAAALLAWEEGGERVVRRVVPREEVARDGWQGGPDLVLDLEAPSGYSLVVRSSGGIPGHPSAVIPATRLGAKGWGMAGTHRPEGILAIRGGGIPPGPLGSLENHRLAAVLLACLGVPAPAHMAEPPALLPHPVTTSGEPTRRFTRAAPGWEWDRLKRLEGLGYLG